MVGPRVLMVWPRTKRLASTNAPPRWMMTCNVLILPCANNCIQRIARSFAQLAHPASGTRGHAKQPGLNCLGWRRTDHGAKPITPVSCIRRRTTVIPLSHICGATPNHLSRAPCHPSFHSPGRPLYAFAPQISTGAKQGKESGSGRNRGLLAPRTAVYVHCA